MTTVTFFLSIAALVFALLALVVALRAFRSRREDAPTTLPSGAVLNPGVSAPRPSPANPPRSSTTISNSTYEVPGEVMELIRQGNKIQAIKVLRDAQPGLGLADAKHAVDQLSLL